MELVFIHQYYFKYSNIFDDFNIDIQCGLKQNFKLAKVGY